MMDGKALGQFRPVRAVLCAIIDFVVSIVKVITDIFPRCSIVVLSYGAEVLLLLRNGFVTEIDCMRDSIESLCRLCVFLI